MSFRNQPYSQPKFQYKPKTISSQTQPKQQTTLETETKQEIKKKLTYLDSHAHLHRLFEQLKQRTNTYPSFLKAEIKPLAESLNSNYEGCVNVYCAPKYFKQAHEWLELEGVWGTFGIHPHYASTYTQDIENQICKWMSHPKCIAWGECGLDFFKNRSPMDVQITVFKRQMEMAIKHDKPLVVHSRDAEDMTLSLMSQTLPRDWKIHFHCFTSRNVKFAKTLLDMFPELFIGFTGVITFDKTSYFDNIIKSIPLERILLETDTPYMAPNGFRGNPSHPGHIPIVARKIADILGTDFETVMTVCRENVKKVYGI